MNFGFQRSTCHLLVAATSKSSAGSGPRRPPKRGFVREERRSSGSTNGAGSRIVGRMAGPPLVSIPELELLYRESYASFARVAAAVAGSEQDGRDAVQDAFAQA